MRHYVTLHDKNAIGRWGRAFERLNSFELDSYGPTHRGDLEMETEIKVYGYKERGHNDGHTHWKPEEAWNGFVPQRSQKEKFPDKTLISDIRLLGSWVKFLLSLVT